MKFLEKLLPKRKPPKTLKVVFTVDVDRDAAEIIPGEAAGGTKFLDHVGKPRFHYTIPGFYDLLKVLNRMKIPATFFVEGETASEMHKLSHDDREALKELVRQGGHEIGCHGHAHEDYTGFNTGVKLGHGEISNSMNSAIGAIKHLFGDAPKGFRAPYMRSNDDVLKMAKKHFSYDSSSYSHARVVAEHDGLPVLHVSKTKIPTTRNGKTLKSEITGYLWPLMERRRKAGDYVKLARHAADNGGVLVLATHSWHHSYSHDRGFPFSKEEVYDNWNALNKVLKSIKGMHGVKVEFVTASRALSLKG